MSQDQNHHFHLNLGLSIPTGDIENGLPYSMQLGSGSYDIESGITYNGHKDNLFWGGQLKIITRIDGSNDYKLGDKVYLNTWGIYPISNTIYASLRLEYSDWKSIDGKGSILETVSTMPPNSNNSGGDKLSLSLGINILNFENQQISIEYTPSANENLSLGQMEMEDMLTIGYQIALK